MLEEKEYARTAGADVSRKKKSLFSTSVASLISFSVKILKIRVACSDMSYRHFKIFAEQGFISYSQHLLLLPGTDYIFDHLASLVDIAAG